MKAARIHEFGDPSVLRYEEAPTPEPVNDQILIRVHAAGINPVDGKIRSGTFHAFRPELPAILGRDVSGVVEKSEISDFGVGDEVFGILDYRRGSYADYAVAAPNEIVKKPKGLGHLQAGCIGVAALTAWQALFDNGELRSGQRVLIHGGSGGVGHYAVQFAAAAGAEVIATANGKDLEFVRSLGAKQVIDYKAQRFEEEVSEIDLVIDLVAGETRKRSWKVLKPGGIMVSTLGEPEIPGDAPKGARSRGMVVETKTDLPNVQHICSPPEKRAGGGWGQNYQLSEIGNRVVNGKVRIEISKVFQLTDPADAHEFLEHEHFRGKIVFAVSEQE
jgi:NADPH:quinone reductase-like Zn-dependent oxidoreductase